MLDEELITWSVDGGGYFFHRPKHRFSVTNVCGYMRADTHQLDYRFLAAQLQLLRAGKKFDYQDKAHPSVIRTSYSLLLPPLPEQRAIATALSDVDALLTALDRLIAKKRDLKQGVMQELLTGRRRLPGFASIVSYKASEVGDIPSDWNVHPLLSVLRIANGQVDPSVAPYRSLTLVAPDHIESRTGRLLDRQTAEEQKAISGKYLFAPGDLLYSKIRPYLRKAVCVDFAGLCSADMYPMTPVGDTSAVFMLAVLLGERFSDFAESVSVRSGMPKINRVELAAYRVALPPPPEQSAIATVLSDMDAELTTLEARRDKTRLLKQGMMQELLTGRTRLV
jgi:type I restriction enzyme S subunit